MPSSHSLVPCSASEPYIGGFEGRSKLNRSVRNPTGPGVFSLNAASVLAQAAMQNLQSSRPL